MVSRTESLPTPLVLIHFAEDSANLIALGRWPCDCCLTRRGNKAFTLRPGGSAVRSGTWTYDSDICHSVARSFLAGIYPSHFPLLKPEHEDSWWRLDVLHESAFKRSSERHPTKKQASLIMNFRGHLQRQPCLIVDVSRGGYRLRGTFRMKRGQVVEVIAKDDPLSVAKCSVIWIGRDGTAQQGQAGLEAIN